MAEWEEIGRLFGKVCMYWPDHTIILEREVMDDSTYRYCAYAIDVWGEKEDHHSGFGTSPVVALKNLFKTKELEVC